MTINLLQKIGVTLGIGRGDLLRIIDTAPKRYKVFLIPKRRGGTRTIAQPSRELKAIQRVVLKEVLAKFPTHAAATGYVRKRNIFHNAVAHADNPALMKLDFKDFFPSIIVDDWRQLALAGTVDLDPYEVWLTGKVLFWGLRSATPICLSIGAPTSPMLSNIIMHSIDVKLTQAAKETNTIYTRYADDITASGVTIEDLKRFETLARSIVRLSASPRLTFNDDKYGVYTSGQRRMVTGLVITPAGRVSIGRERKRLISAMIHRWTLGSLDNEDKAILKGFLGFSVAAEPDFVSRMREKYGDAPLDGILRYQVVRRGPPGRPRSFERR